MSRRRSTRDLELAGARQSGVVIGCLFDLRCRNAELKSASSILPGVQLTHIGGREKQPLLPLCTQQKFQERHHCITTAQFSSCSFLKLFPLLSLQNAVISHDEPQQPFHHVFSSMRPKEDTQHNGRSAASDVFVQHSRQEALFTRCLQRKQYQQNKGNAVCCPCPLLPAW